MQPTTGRTYRIPDSSKEMWCIVRKSEVIDDNLKLPRPKIVKDILIIGDKLSIFEMLEEWVHEEENKSTDQIEVTLKAERYYGQRSTTSSRPGNGRR
jgi:FKBP-type peptidyl-prolyl cis-trans isomerase 2